jgi:hypothetical protein
MAALAAAASLTSTHPPAPSPLSHHPFQQAESHLESAKHHAGIAASETAKAAKLASANAKGKAGSAGSDAKGRVAGAADDAKHAAQVTGSVMKRSVKSVAADAEGLAEEAAHRWVLGLGQQRLGWELAHALGSPALNTRCAPAAHSPACCPASPQDVWRAEQPEAQHCRPCHWCCERRGLVCQPLCPPRQGRTGWQG